MRHMRIVSSGKPQRYSGLICLSTLYIIISYINNNFLSGNDNIKATMMRIYIYIYIYIYILYTHTHIHTHLRGLSRQGDT